MKPNNYLSNISSFSSRNSYFKSPQLTLTEMGDKVMKNILLVNNWTELILIGKSFPYNHHNFSCKGTIIQMDKSIGAWGISSAAMQLSCTFIFFLKRSSLFIKKTWLSLLKDYLPINKCYHISVHWAFFPCDLLFPCIRVLLFTRATLKG